MGMKPILLVLFMLVPTLAFSAKQRRMFNSLGSSPKGQYVAIEEYGFDASRGMYFSRIKLMNVWKKQYVGAAIEVERAAKLPLDLDEVRRAARIGASEQLERYQIITSG